ncbi:MAG: flagellar biosynthesis protein FlhB [Gammaproteobacteria bacterium]
MAEKDSGQERTEQATPKRLQEAREKGQIARSLDLNSTVMLLASAGGFLVLGGRITSGLLDSMRHNFHISRENVFNPGAMLQLLEQSVADALTALAPFLVLMIVAALLAPLALGGWSFSSEALGFKWEKLSPLSGLKRIFGPHGLMELVKAFAKFIVLGAAAVVLLWNMAGDFVGLGDEPLPNALGHVASLLGWSFLALSGTMVLIAAVDVPFQIWDHSRKLKMTHQEIKEEFKETDGNPEVKGRIRSQQREMARRRMMAEIPKADVIVTNPTHYAVALRYDPDKMRSPVVVAKGADLIALQIRTVAVTHRIPILSAPPLARALHHSTELNHAIPAGLYLAVAQVLAYVYQLKQRQHSGAQYDETPLTMAELPIPDELRRDE